MLAPADDRASTSSALIVRSALESTRRAAAHSAAWANIAST